MASSVSAALAKVMNQFQERPEKASRVEDGDEVEKLNEPHKDLFNVMEKLISVKFDKRMDNVDKALGVMAEVTGQRIDAISKTLEQEKAARVKFEQDDAAHGRHAEAGG